MSPTGRTLWIVVAWALFGLAASVWRELLSAWWIGGAVVAGVALFDALTLAAMAKVEITRRLPGRFAVGEAGDVRLEIRNPGRIPATVEIFDGIPAGAEAETMPWKGTIAPARKARVTYGVRIIERGMATFGQVHVRRASGLGLWLRYYLTGEAEEVKVYPDCWRCSSGRSRWGSCGAPLPEAAGTSTSSASTARVIRFRRSIGRPPRAGRY